ncbi:hypothetical protein [Litoreibacter albidus]|uniref:hypothetical protein n=1 Tax=Litoreibacter albidus TaxID=670155 RepID=UPI003736C105
MNSPTYTLDDIRRHPAFPFPAWPNDDHQFLMLELYWAERVRELLGEDLSGYAPLFDTDRDGNPILTLTNTQQARGLRLVVLENENAKPVYPDSKGPDAFYGLYGFTNKGRLPDGTTQVDELVLLVHLDERYAKHFDSFVKWHCVENLPMSEMERRLQEYETEIGQSSPDADFSDD